MPRRGTRPGPPTLLLGVWGQGESTPDNVGALLDDFLEGAGNVSPRFLVPLDKELTTETITAVLDYAVEKDIPYEVVYERKPTTRALKTYIEGAAKEHQFDDKVTDDDRFESTEDAIADNFAVMLGEKPDDARLLFLWAEDDKGDPDEDDQRLLAAVADCGVVALDLTQGLDVLDVGAADDGGEPEPEPEKPAKKAAAGKKTAAAKEEPVEEPEDVDYDTFKDWPIRRMKQHARKVAAADRRDGVEGAPSDDEVAEWGKDAIIDYLYPEDDPAAAAEPEPEPAKDETITPRRARQMRESAEAEGKDTLAAAKRGAKKTAAASEPEPEGGDGTDGGGEALDRLVEAVEVLADSDATEEEVKDAVRDFADAFADHIIDRIAERVEKEPEKSAIREEIAPPRPPGKPRKDGATPTRRRTARGR
jgi:hypothetical protein